MTGHDDIDAVELLRHIGDIVDDVNRRAAQFDARVFGQSREVIGDIVVAAHDGERRERRERIEHVASADIARVDDVRGAAQGVEALRGARGYGYRR